MLVVAIQRGQSADREFWFLAPGVFDAAFVECGCAQRSGFVPKQRSTLTPAIPLDKPWWADCVELQRRQPVEAKSLTLAASRRTPAIEAIAPGYSSKLESTALLKARVERQTRRVANSAHLARVHRLRVTHPKPVGAGKWLPGLAL